MTTFDRLKQLCRSETRHLARSPEDPGYLDWLSSKSSFSRSDVAGKWFVKIGDRCGGYLARLEADGTIFEMDIFNPTKTWPGTWAILENGALEITVLSGNEETGPVTCTLDIIASQDGCLHAGAESTTLNDNVEIFKVIDLGAEISLPKYGDGSKIPASG